MIKNLGLYSLRSPYLDDSKVYAPMATLYLKAYLNKHAPSTSVFLGDDHYDLNNLSTFHSFDAVGLSIMTPQRAEAYRLANAIKKEYPHIKLIAGGPHVKHYKDEVMQNTDFDYVVPYDGEKVLARLCRGEATDRLLSDVLSKEEILTAPRPDRTSENARTIISEYHYMLRDRQSTTMMTSRGCPMACAFCEDARTIAKWSSLDNLVGEMDDIRSLGYGGVYLFDDLFAIAMEKVRPIAEELKRHDLIYRCNGQANFFTKWGEDFARLLSDTGCVEIAFGHESGSQKILDNVNKKTKVEQNYQSVEFARKHGIKVKSFLMLGLPGEDDETVKATEDFIRIAQPDDFQLCVYAPFKGTEIRDRIDKGDTSMDLFFEGEKTMAYGQKGGKTESCVRTARFSSEELVSIRDELVAKYKPKSHGAMWKEDKFFEQVRAEDLNNK